MVLDLATGVAHPAPARVDGDALVWELTEAPPGDALLSADVDLDPSTRWIMRCDLVDFEPGGVAWHHTHPGPGVRCLLAGEITIEAEGERHTHGPFEAWFERGPDPVLATTSESEASAFARVMLLPAEYAGKRTISYVDPADAEKPRRQRATILVEAPVRG